MNIENLFLIGAGLWVASRFLNPSKKRPGGGGGGGGVKSKGSIKDVSLGQASMGALVVKPVGSTVTIAVVGSVATVKGVTPIAWPYAFAYSVLGQNTGAMFKSGASVPVTAPPTNTLNTTFEFVVPATMENKVFKVNVRLLAANPNPDGTPSASFGTLLAERTVEEAIQVPAEAVASSGAINTVTVSQRGLMAMYAGR